MNYSNDSIYQESLSASIGTVSRKIRNSADVNKIWHDLVPVKKRSYYESSSVSDDDYEMLKELIDKLLSTPYYFEYKKYFNKLCNYCRITSDGTTITKHHLKRGDTDCNYLYVEYHIGTKKITIPNGYGLYHMSQVDNINELKPVFRGKDTKGYLYDAPRVYFSIKKNMSRLGADIYGKKSTITKYKCCENIKTAYIDPLLWHSSMGAVYVQTSMPIKVENISKSIGDDIIMNLNENTNNINELQEFMEYYGLIPIFDDDVYQESLAATIGQKIRDTVNMKEIKKQWKKLASKIKTRNHIDVDVKFNDLEKLKNAYAVVCKKEVSYPQYKKAFDILANYAKLPPNDITLEAISFYRDKVTGLDKMYVRYSQGKIKVMIPNGTELTHMSPVAGIKELKPAFRSRTKGKYLYPNPKVFFTLSKSINPKKAGLEGKKTYRYTPKEKFQIAYIDPACSNFSTGAVYIDSRFPIPVIEVSEKIKKLFAKESTGNTSINNLKIAIYEAGQNGEINEDTKYELLSYLD